MAITAEALSTLGLNGEPALLDSLVLWLTEQEFTSLSDLHSAGSLAALDGKVSAFLHKSCVSTLRAFQGRSGSLLRCWQNCSGLLSVCGRRVHRPQRWHW